MPCISGIQDLIAWSSPSGVARALYINGAEWDDSAKAIGIFARIWMTLLLLVPFCIGVFEVAIGIMNRHSPQGCAYPLPAWVIVDGSAALLVTLLSIVDIARVQKIARDEEKRLDEDESTPAVSQDTAAARERRLSQMGTYVALGCAVIIIIPLFRLLWVLFGVDLVYRVDPAALGSLRVPDTLNVGACSRQLYEFMFYYLEAVMFLLLVTAAAILFLVVSIAVQCLPATCCTGAVASLRQWVSCGCCTCCDRPAPPPEKKKTWLQSITQQSGKKGPQP